MNTGIRTTLITLFFSGYIILTGNLGIPDNRLLYAQSDDDAPVLREIESSDLIYRPGDPGAIITRTLEVRAESRYLRSATVRISGGFNAEEDVLLFNDTEGISGTWNEVEGILTLEGRARVRNYQTALRSIRYVNRNAVHPSRQDRIIAFRVNDGETNSNTVSRKLVIQVINAAPVLSGIESTALIYCVKSGPVAVTATLTVADPDNASLASAAVQISTGYIRNEDFLRYTTLHGITGIWDANTGRLSLAGIASKDNYIAALRSIRYEHSGTRTSSRNVSFTVNDGLGNSNTLTRNILLHGLVSAVISGNVTLCEHQTANLNVTLTGESPWKFSYRRNSENPVEVPNVLSSPYTLAVQQSGTYTLYDIYDKYCEGTFSGSASVTYSPGPDVVLSGIGPAYEKQSTVWIPITGTPVGGTFSGPGVIPYEQQWYFVPSLPPVGTHHIIYAYQESPGTCYGYDTAVVRILEASAVIEFENHRTKYCRNDRSFTVTGINLANDIGSFTISGGIGLTNHGNNTATVYPALLAPGEFTITYTYYDGTTLSISRNFDVGHAPVADFKWDNECYHAGHSVKLINTSLPGFGNLTDTSYLWKIRTSTGYVPFFSEDVTYFFPQPGSHTIELLVENTYGCTDSAERVLNLRPTFSLAGETYFEDFDSNPGDWQSGAAAIPDKNSWKLGDPLKGFSAPSSGTHCWYTHIATYPAPREQSWVTSPCFDFTGTEKPMLKLDIWRLFNSNRDGANVQATIDHGRTWMLIGQLEDGIEWFNSYTIAGYPGGSSVGWSNNDMLSNDTGWVEARHALDMLKGETEVQFRIAYGSDLNAQGNDGIAFDNFWIGERNRTALLEHFTNSADADCVTPDLLINTFANAHENNIIDLQYHTSYPGNDPFNQHNPSVPAARAFYYGLADVPYTILSGGSTAQHRFDYNAQPLNTTMALVESLRDSKFWINLVSKLADHSISVTAQIYALEPIPARQLTIHLAVVERIVTDVTGGNGETSFESVVKAFLPDAAGTAIYDDWDAEEPRLISASWPYRNIYDYDELRVVAFIQDETTREIYQAAIDTIGIINDLVELPVTGRSAPFILYPNPARQQVFIRFSQETTEAGSLELYNNLGALIRAEQFPSGTLEARIPLEAYPEGIYWVRWLAGGKLSSTERLTVTKSD